MTTLSELYDGALADLLTGALEVGWEERERRHSTRARFEMAGVPEALLAEFSQRAGQVAAHAAELRAQFAAAHGREPTAVEDMRLHQVATLATRPAKSHASLQELTEGWRERADRHVPRALQAAWVTSLAGRNDLPLLTSDDLGEAILADAARAVLAQVAERHATFSRMNVLAEAHRVLHGARFRSPSDRVEVTEQVSRLALGAALPVSAPELCHTPAAYRRPDGSSRLRPESRALYTTQALLDAEARLLDAGRSHSAPAVSTATVARACQGRLPGREYGLSTDQALAVEKVAMSGRALDVLVGPSGTGKSTTMAGLRAVWEAEHGPGSVLGLAPTAAGAEVLAAELGTATENTAKWLTEWRRVPELTARRDRLAAQAANRAMSFPAHRKLGGTLGALDQAVDARRLHAGQLVIVVEASLAGTFALDELVSAAREAGAKVLLVGDWAQLSALEAGGAFRLLVANRGDAVPELGDVQRFQAEWEKAASLGLRLGKEGAIGAYEAHGRVTGGEREAVLDELYRAWKSDIGQGRESLMVAPDSATVSELNGRARADRVAAGRVAGEGLVVSDGQVAGVGDEVVTRENNRLLATGRRWVKNGDRWVVRATNADGSMAVRRPDGKGDVVLPADYVRQHVELAYATTAYRAQGRTVATAHAMVSPTTTREVLYVSATRGREENRLYVDTCFDPDPPTSHHGIVGPQSARAVLAGVLAREGGEISAHEALGRAQREAQSFAVVAAEYSTIARDAQQQRFDGLLGRCRLDPACLASAHASEAYGPLLTALREAEASGLDIDEALPRLAVARSLAGVHDPIAVLHARVERWAAAAASRRQANAGLIAGLIPRAGGVEDEDLARSLVEQDGAMERRARELAEQALREGQAWARSLGPEPSEGDRREAWLRAVSTVAAFRERWELDPDPRPLGAENTVTSLEALGQRRSAEAAAACALRLANRTALSPAQSVVPAGPELVNEGGALL